VAPHEKIRGFITVIPIVTWMQMIAGKMNPRLMDFFINAPFGDRQAL